MYKVSCSDKRKVVFMGNTVSHSKKKKKKRIPVTLTNRDIDKEVKLPLLCPKCGKPMKYTELQNSGSTVKRYICSECDIAASVKEVNGTLKLLSTPANRRLRTLRYKAHLYQDRIVESGIMDVRGLYKYMSVCCDTDGMLHIGFLNELTCAEYIEKAKAILREHGVPYDDIT